MTASATKKSMLLSARRWFSRAGTRLRLYRPLDLLLAKAMSSIDESNERCRRHRWYMRTTDRVKRDYRLHKNARCDAPWHDAGEIEK